jgi:CheY-like chemotaxis protein
MSSTAEILLVEDNKDHLELTLRAFRKVNNDRKIQVARDGAEALDYVFRSGPYEARNPHQQIAVVLLDLKLPKINGLEVLSRIKSNDQTRHIPVVILTSSQQEEDRAESYKRGANSYIVKPLSFERLTEVVAQIASYWLQINERIY